MTIELVLHDYWRSTASYRVRIALALKGVGYRQIAHDLRSGAHGEAAFRALNPQALVPVIEAESIALTQSPAILEWLEERLPQPALLPPGATGRAVVRAMMHLICCDIHPLNNLRVLTALRRDLQASETQVSAWIERWITEGFAALEVQIAAHGGGFSWGASPTLADCCLVPQVYSAERFGVSMAAYPAIRACVDRCLDMEPFQRAHPNRQPGSSGSATGTA